MLLVLTNRYALLLRNMYQLLSSPLTQGYWRGHGGFLPVPVLSLRRSSYASESSTRTTSSIEGANFWKSRSQTASMSDQITL